MRGILCRVTLACAGSLLVALLHVAHEGSRAVTSNVFSSFSLGAAPTERTDGGSLLARFSRRELKERWPSCRVQRLAFGASSSPFDPQQPALMTGWRQAELLHGQESKEQYESLQTPESFAKHGDCSACPQYVKDGAVQPRRRRRGEGTDTAGNASTWCTATTAEVVTALRVGWLDMPLHFPSVGEDLLLFTNDLENPGFFEALSVGRLPPAPFPFVGRTGVFRVFSAMAQGSSHPLHAHEAAWLGEVSGSRIWIVAPPPLEMSAVVGSRRDKRNACEILFGSGGAEFLSVDWLGNATQVCVQQPGEAFYLPRRWLHATCALSQWNVGIGHQVGSPANFRQNFSDVQRSHREGDSIVDCDWPSSVLPAHRSSEGSEMAQIS